MKKTFIILSLLFSSNLFGQGFTYSYVDPCSKKQKVITLSGNQNVTVNYLGFIGSFSQNDFSNGNFDNWMSNIQTQAANQPCDEMLTQTQTSQNVIITQNIISTLTSVTAASSLNMSNSISNSVDNSSSSGSTPKRNRNSTNNQNTSNNGTTNQSNNTSSGSVSSSSTTTNGGTQSGTNTGGSQPSGGGNNTQGEGTNQNGGNSSGSGNSTEGGSGQTQPPVNNPSSNPPSSNTGSGTQSGTNTGQGGGGNTQSGTNPTDGPKQETTGGGGGGTTNSVANAAEASSGSGNGGGSKVRVGSIIGTGDIVAIRSNEDGSNQFKGTMSMTKSNTNNTKAKGFLLNFTSTINNTNLTLYGAFSNKKKTSTTIVANSSMIDFERNFFNTTTAMQTLRFGKVTTMGGLNLTLGNLSGEGFNNISAIGGGFVPFKAGKKVTGNLLMLGVYSPFTKFYEGKWWDSGLLLVPFSSWDYTISKSFKYNVSFSGTYQLKGSVLNYQILTGAKILL